MTCKAWKVVVKSNASINGCRENAPRKAPMVYILIKKNSYFPSVYKHKNDSFKNTLEWRDVFILL